VERVGNPGFWISTLSTAPSFPQLSFWPALGFSHRSRRLIHPHSGFPPVDSSWLPPRGSS
jgi:hypothetical protein